MGVLGVGMFTGVVYLSTTVWAVLLFHQQLCLILHLSTC